MVKSSILFFVWLFFFGQAVGQTNTWTGSTDNDWHKACNWSLDLIPTVAHDVIVPNSTEYPSITGNAHCKTLSITSTAVNAVNLNNPLYHRIKK